VLEVNSNPAWRGLQGVADINIAWAIAEDFLKTVVGHRAVSGIPVAAVP
jgi:tetrahydromethanopterin:alpha-L-glutamate ligase